MPTVLFFAALLTVFAVVVVVWLLLKSPSDIPLERRRPPRTAEPGVLNKWSTRFTAVVEKVLERRGSGGLDVSLERAGLKMPAKEAIFLTVCAMVAFAAVGSLFGSVVLAVLLPVAVPFAGKAALSMLKQRRQKQFGLQLEETTQLLSGQLRSGYSFNQAVAAVADELESPSKEEFGRITQEVRLGRNLGDALAACAARMESDDFKMLGEAVAINREVGGNLADVIDKTGDTLRMRAELHRRVQTLAAEGKMSAYLLMALPFGMGGYMAVSNPKSFSFFFNNLLGLGLLGLVAVMLTIGGLWMKSIIKIKY